MAHSIKTGIIFNHNPKCGGMWVTEALKNADIYEKVLGKGVWGSHTIKTASVTFTFIRHPLSWYKSWHAYWKERGVKSRENNTFVAKNWREDLNETIQIYTSHHPGFLTRAYRRYIVCSLGGICLVGKQEYLMEHLVLILKCIGVGFDEMAIKQTPSINMSPQVQELARKSKGLIEKSERVVFKTFYPRTPFSSNNIMIFRG